MATILDTKDNNVTEGVIDKNVQTHEKLKSVTFRDIFGTVHTVFAHADGPFRTPEDVVNAFEKGILHTFETHQAAVEHWAAREGNGEFVKLLKSAAGSSSSQESQSGGGY